MAHLRNVQEQLLINLVYTRPFPSFDEMIFKLQTRHDLLFDYSPSIHDCCKLIYEHPFNSILVIDQGKFIYSIGGISGLRTSFNVISYMWKGYGSARLSKNFEEVTSDWTRT